MFSYWSIAWDNCEETRPPSLQLAGHVRSRDDKLLLMEDSLQLGLELLAGLLQVVYLLSMGLMYQGLFRSTIHVQPLPSSTICTYWSDCISCTCQRKLEFVQKFFYIRSEVIGSHLKIPHWILATFDTKMIYQTVTSDYVPVGYWIPCRVVASA